ncbi:MAG: M50 family metallopeptidase [Nitrososphaerota archaeon]|nr:M50 family metallopeptidase [Nitrososphaerota archaeon]MDG6967250.1 M50 family metallopeptidase [Nitrososphaerota archaeon]MDG6977895.1 M50 family metallopeptidase [Nitrososphaerota archaeon]MDG7005847.1 M50 family metallopeptidase [Nitrososphaerota archaeon]MDG7021596.1 M50 family metallopeptidase [Nitrososphaerota archaeon]
MSAINPEVDAAVRSLFKVKDYFVAEEGAAEYSVAYDGGSGDAFLRLLDLLEKPDYSAQLYGSPESATLQVVKNPPPPKPQGAVKLSAPAFLFLLSLLSALVTGYVVGLVFPQISPGASPIELGAGFVLALVAAFAARYVAQLVASERGRFNFRSFYLPNVPIFIAIPTMYFLPAFGSVSFPSSPPANKNRLFDFYLVGALVLAAVAVLVSFLAAGTSVVLSQAQYAALAAGNQTATIQTNPSLVQAAATSLSQALGATPAVPPGGTMIFSPLGVAGWLCLLLAFFNLLPAALFDGGRMARLAMGERWTRVAALVAGALLLLTDVPDYWVVFVLVLLMAAFPIQGETLDSITGLSRSRKAAFVAAVLVGLLCVPMPQSFATLPL